MLSVLLTLSLLPQDPPPAQALFELLPLDHLVAEPQHVAPPLWGSMLTWADLGDTTRRPDLLAAREGGASVDTNAVLEVLHWLHAPALENGGLRCDPLDTCLQVFGDPPTVAAVRDEIRILGSALQRPLLIEATWWDAGDKPTPGAVLGPREFSQFAEQHTAIWRSQVSARHAVPVALDQQRWTRYVRSVEVEVAQKASIASAATNSFGEGGRVVVVPFTLLGGDDLVLDVQFGIADRRGPVAMQPTGVPGQPDLDVPMLETTYGACSGRITNGGALAIALTGLEAGGGNRVLTVRVISKTPPAAATLPGIAVYPVGALTSTALRQRLSAPHHYPVLGDEANRPGMDVEETNGFGTVPEDHLIELIRESLGAAAEEAFDVTQTGGFLLAHADPTKLARVDALLRALEDRLLRTATVRHTIAAPPSNGAAGVPLHELSAPTLLGRYVTIARMLETNVQRDVLSEIAQEAQSACPLVEELQTGAWFRARVTPRDDTGHLQLLAQCSTGAPPQPRRIQPNGLLQLPSVAVVRTSHDGTVARGQPIEHGDSAPTSAEPRTGRTVATTTVTY